MVQVAHALDQLFMIYFFGGEEIRMLYAGLAALNFSEDVGKPTPVLARAYGTLQTIAASIPLHGQMRYFIDKAGRTTEAVDSMSATSWVLLTKATGLPGVIAAELDRLNPQRIVVLGGPGAVSDTVKLRLAAYTDGPVDRWSGIDRFASRSSGRSRPSARRWRGSRPSSSRA